MKRANFGRSVRTYLAIHDIKSPVLAQMMGCSYNRAVQCTKLESATLITIQKFADKFGMSASEFIALGELEEKNAGV